MNPIFKYNGNTKYLIKYLKGAYAGSDFSLLDVYLNEKGPPLKTQWLNVFKDNQIERGQVLQQYAMIAGHCLMLFG